MTALDHVDFDDLMDVRRARWKERRAIRPWRVYVRRANYVWREELGHYQHDGTWRLEEMSASAKRWGKDSYMAWHGRRPFQSFRHAVAHGIFHASYLSKEEDFERTDVTVEPGTCYVTHTDGSAYEVTIRRVR